MAAEKAPPVCSVLLLVIALTAGQFIHNEAHSGADDTCKGHMQDSMADQLIKMIAALSFLQKACGMTWLI
jgi:hypothetical protein